MIPAAIELAGDRGIGFEARKFTSGGIVETAFRSMV
jgi:hypothetical protein